MQIRAIDHFVLVVLNIETTIRFYTRVLGLEARETTSGRWALHFGNQKINLQQLHLNVDDKSLHPNRGAADFCLLTDTPIAEVVSQLEQQGVKIVTGPGQRNG